MKTKVLVCCSPLLAAKLIKLLDAKGIEHKLLLDPRDRTCIQNTAAGCTIAVVEVSDTYPCGVVMSHLPSGRKTIGYIINPIRLFFDAVVRAGLRGLEEVVQKILVISGESAAV